MTHNEWYNKIKELEEALGNLSQAEEDTALEQVTELYFKYLNLVSKHEGIKDFAKFLASRIDVFNDQSVKLQMEEPDTGALYEFTATIKEV